MAENLIINGVDHAKFDLEWAKRGGVFVVLDLPTMYSLYYTIVQQIAVQIESKNAIEVWGSDTPVIEVVTDLEKQPEFIVRMATPDECAEEGVEYIEPPYAELEELRKDRDLLQFCLDNDTFPVKDQSGAYIMSKDNEFFSVSDSPRKSIELAMDYVKFKADNAMRGE